MGCIMKLQMKILPRLIKLFLSPHRDEAVEVMQSIHIAATFRLWREQGIS